MMGLLSVWVADALRSGASGTPATPKQRRAMQRKARPGASGSVRLEFLGTVLLGRRVDGAALRAEVIAAREAAVLAVVAKLRVGVGLQEGGPGGGVPKRPVRV